MTNVKFFTLAQARLQDAAAFDQLIERAVLESAERVGLASIARSLCQRTEQQDVRKLAA